MQWMTVLNRFASSPGNTVGVKAAVIGESRANLLEKRSAVKGGGRCTAKAERKCPDGMMTADKAVNKTAIFLGEGSGVGVSVGSGSLASPS